LVADSFENWMKILDFLLRKMDKNFINNSRYKPLSRVLG
jgi:hypothetical protein